MNAADFSSPSFFSKELNVPCLMYVQAFFCAYILIYSSCRARKIRCRAFSFESTSIKCFLERVLLAILARNVVVETRTSKLSKFSLVCAFVSLFIRYGAIHCQLFIRYTVNYLMASECMNTISLILY